MCFAQTFEKLHTSSKVNCVEQEVVKSIAERLRERAKKTLEVAEVTTNAENEEAKLEEQRTVDTVDAQLGRLLVKRNLKIADILIKWDANGNGTVSKSEFRFHVRELGVTAENPAIDECFNSYDADSGGSLDISEIKPALKKLAQAAKDADQALEKATKSTAVKKKFAKRAQVEHAQTQTTEQKNALEVAAKRDEEERIKREADEAAKAIADAKKAAKAAERAARASAEAEALAAKEAARDEAYNRLMGGGSGPTQDEAAVAIQSKVRARAAKKEVAAKKEEQAAAKKQEEQIASKKAAEVAASSALAASTFATSRAIASAAASSAEGASLPPRMADVSNEGATSAEAVDIADQARLQAASPEPEDEDEESEEEAYDPAFVKRQTMEAGLKKSRSQGKKRGKLVDDKGDVWVG